MTRNETVEKFREAWLCGNAGKLTDCFTDDADYHIIPIKVLAGKKNIYRFSKCLLKRIKVSKIDINDCCIFSEGHVIADWKVHMSWDNLNIVLPVTGDFNLELGKIKKLLLYIDLEIIQGGKDKALKANWSLKELYESTRELIKHEDILGSERIKALFTIQTILFATFGIFWKEHSESIIIILTPLGLFSALSYGIELFIGRKAVCRITEDWEQHTILNFKDIKTPRVIGDGVKGLFKHLLPNMLVPWAFGICWLWILMSLFQPAWLPKWLLLPLKVTSILTEYVRSTS